MLGLYAFLIARLWPDTVSWAHWFVGLLFFSEGVVALLLLIRRPTERISTRRADWAVAMAGTFLALLVGPGAAPISPVIGGLLMTAGVLVHAGAKLSLWRSFGVVAADRGVRAEGLYRFVRHPMYAGYMLAHVGYLLLAPSLWNLAVYIGVWALLIARIGAEERILDQDPAYAALRARTPYRLIPGLY